jgi:CRP/FNR family cyclic AMP-dependent transcriptional regulator
MTSSVSFLDRLADEDRAAIAAQWSVRRYDGKELIIAHDDESSDLFFMIEGRARATSYSEGGRAIAYRDIGPGDIFGELAAIDGGPRSASVVALKAALVGRLSGPKFRELVSAHPRFTWALLTHLALQVRRMTERVYEFSTLVVRKRLIRELLRLSENGDMLAGAASIRPAPTHFDLASRISTHREAVSREMSALARKKFIQKRGDVLMLHDVAALRSLCDKEE